MITAAITSSSQPNAASGVPELIRDESMIPLNADSAPVIASVCVRTHATLMPESRAASGFPPTA